MSQKREPPAYQEYAANMLANADFRSMSLAERGLLYTIRLECWANKRLPADPEKLSRFLGSPQGEVTAALNALASFVEVRGDFIVCPELDSYREHLEQRKAKQSAGGKKGAAKINQRNCAPDEPAGNPTSTPPGTSASTPTSTSASTLTSKSRGGRESLVKPNTAKPNTALKMEASHQEFVNEINEYERASRGH
ncbi:hypothetical protein [Aquabacterium sp.]|uniref:hypothetical protein n=1 Tax=Aquabacterium sp. TaxID=1872578 RepID=UPI0035AF2F67